MKPGQCFLVAVMIAFLFASAPAFAHHGQATYDMTKLSTVTGTVSDFEFTNPHIHVFLDVKGSAGNHEKWIGEGTSPNMLVREGWNKNTLKPGDQIVAMGHLARNHTNVLLIERVVLSNGRTITLEAPGN